MIYYNDEVVDDSEVKDNRNGESDIIIILEEFLKGSKKKTN